MSYDQQLANAERENADLKQRLSEAVQERDLWMLKAKGRYKPMDGYDNLLAIVEGRVSGSITEWPAIRLELMAFMDSMTGYAEKCRAIATKAADDMDDTANDMSILTVEEIVQRLREGAQEARAALSKKLGESNAPPVVGTHEELEPYGNERPSPADESGGRDRGACGDELRASGAQCGARAASAETGRSEVAGRAGTTPALTERHGVGNAADPPESDQDRAQRMQREYQQTGAMKAADVHAVLGDPATGVSLPSQVNSEKP